MEETEAELFHLVQSKIATSSLPWGTWLILGNG